MTASEFLGSLGPLFPGADSVTQVVALAGIAAALLTPAEYFAPACRQPLVLRKGFWLDAAYWFTTPLLTRSLTACILAVLLLAGGACIGFDRIRPGFMMHGFGPLSRQATWLQTIEILVVADFVDYWTHRTLHRGSLWRIHAIHHSPEEMSWLSSSRVHPLNDLITRSCQLVPIVSVGFSALAVAWAVPLISFYVMFLHANLKWGFGPLRWVLVSPAYHRWHHATDDEAIDKNFAGIFPVWDVLFGTAYFPRTLPTRYGLRGERLPDSLVAHLLYPVTGPDRARGRG
jgi:sterol desaturase/sphingolipid hydroxylase (fatty acid hydroxylase superfamily)